MSFLDNIKQKPRHVRAQISILAAFLITGVIGGIWSTTLPARFAAIGEVVQTEEQEDKPGIFDTLIDTTRTQLGSALEAVQGEEEYDDVYIPPAPEEMPDFDQIVPMPEDMMVEEAVVEEVPFEAPPARTILIATTSSATNDEIDASNIE